MGVKARPHQRIRDHYDPSAFDQFSVEPDEIPDDAPTHCACCRQALTPLRRLSGKEFCTEEPCLLAARQAKTAHWRMANLHKQGDTLVIVEPGTVVSTSRRGSL